MRSVRTFYTTHVMNEGRQWSAGDRRSPHSNISHPGVVLLLIQTWYHTKEWEISLSRIMDTVTGWVIFRMGGRYPHPFDVQSGGKYVVIRYRSGDILVLDFNHVSPSYSSKRFTHAPSSITRNPTGNEMAINISAVVLFACLSYSILFLQIFHCPNPLEISSLGARLYNKNMAS